jgi:hypothetical protein
MSGGRKVKVYSVFSENQASFRCSISRFSEQIYLPKVLAKDGRIIVEEWIDGSSPNVNDKEDWERFRCSISNHIFSPNRINKSKKEVTDFDYLDYLVKRVSLWGFMQSIDDFTQAWLEQRRRVSNELVATITNPDLTSSNFVIESNSRKVFLIDNEFLHVGYGGFMDFYNSAIRKEEHRFSVSDSMQAFHRNTVKLRHIGSALIQGDLMCIDETLFDFEKD